MADVMFWLIPHVLCLALHGIMVLASFVAFALTGNYAVNHGGVASELVMIPWLAFGMVCVSQAVEISSSKYRCSSYICFEYAQTHTCWEICVSSVSIMC